MKRHVAVTANDDVGNEGGWRCGMPPPNGRYGTLYDGPGGGVGEGRGWGTLASSSPSASVLRSERNPCMARRLCALEDLVSPMVPPSPSDDDTLCDVRRERSVLTAATVPTGMQGERR